MRRRRLWRDHPHRQLPLSSLFAHEPVAAIHALGREDGRRSADENSQVKTETPVFAIPEIELDPLVPVDRVSAVHLCPSGKPWLYLQATPLALCISLNLVGQGGTGPDEAHLPAQDVDELRQLVE